MIKYILIIFVIITTAFSFAVHNGILQYVNHDNNFYMVKAERYAYSDSFSENTIVLVGTSISAPYTINRTGYSFINMGLIGRSSLEALDIIKYSGHIPKVLIVEANLFDNYFDSSIIDKLYFPVIKDAKKHLFFIQREYKFHNLLPKSFFDTNKKFWGKFVQSTGLYSEQQKKIDKEQGGAKNVLIEEEFIFKQNIKNQTAFDDTSFIVNRIKTLTEQLKYFKEKGTQIILYQPPVMSILYNCERNKYRAKLIKALSNELNAPFIEVPDNNAYQDVLKGGDGVHIHNPIGKQQFQAFLNDTLATIINTP